MRSQLLMNRIQRKADAFASTLDEYSVFSGAAIRRSTVMLITFLEEYLEEGLVSIAVKNQDLVKNTPSIKRGIRSRLDTGIAK
jgi:hypothetical protein